MTNYNDIEFIHAKHQITRGENTNKIVDNSPTTNHW